MQQFDQENMYPPQNYHHQHQKRYQPHHQYYQNPRYNHQFENPHHYFETPNEEEMMYPLPTHKKVYAHTKIESTPQEVIFADDGNDEFYDDDEITIEGDTIALLSDTDNAIMAEDNSNSIDNISSDTVEHESVEIPEGNSEIADDMKNTENNTTNEPEYDNVEEEEELEEVQEEEDVSSSEN